MPVKAVAAALMAGIVFATSAFAQAVPQAAKLGAAPQAPGAKPAGPKSAATKPAKPGIFRTADDMGRFINTYRQKPEPQRLREVFRAMTELGLLVDTESSGLYLGFIGGMLAADPAKANAIVTHLFPLEPQHQAALIKAIAYSGLPEWRQLLRDVAERMPSRVVLIDRFITGRMQAYDALQLDAGPVPLDVLWGNYFATGSYDPILRIVSVLEWSKDANDVERLTIGSMAKWTLATNAGNDPDLLRLLKSAVAVEPPKNQRLLTEVMQAAETGEISKIRKEALIAIDQLKAKGPANTRSVAWWGQAGQMALALGCVTASALGAGAAIGIPCVIGGGASTAALKLLAPQ